MTTRPVLSFVTAALLLASVPGCGGSTPPLEPPKLPPKPCEPGEWRGDDGTCQQAGLPGATPQCAPGEAPKPGGGCDPAGTPPDACAPGFMAKDSACWPELPKSACPVGQMALPGETSCRPVA